MNMPKSRDIQAKIPLPQAIWNFGYITVNGVNSNLEIFSKGQEWGIALYFVRFYCMISNDRISFLSLILSKRRIVKQSIILILVIKCVEMCSWRYCYEHIEYH